MILSLLSLLLALFSWLLLSLSSAFPAASFTFISIFLRFCLFFFFIRSSFSRFPVIFFLPFMIFFFFPFVLTHFLLIFAYLRPISLRAINLLSIFHLGIWVAFLLFDISIRVINIFLFFISYRYLLIISLPSL